MTLNKIYLPLRKHVIVSIRMTQYHIFNNFKVFNDLNIAQQYKLIFIYFPKLIFILYIFNIYLLILYSSTV